MQSLLHAHLFALADPAILMDRWFVALLCGVFVVAFLYSSVGHAGFCRDGHFSWRLFLPFAVLAVPLAFVGGSRSLPVTAFRIVVGIVLLFSATWMVVRPPAESDAVRPPRLAIALAVGAALGLLSGLTGTGGGIFLTPMLLFFRWSPARGRWCFGGFHFIELGRRIAGSLGLLIAGLKLVLAH
jgi:uncharacterized membrane protein YfcA